MIVLDDDQAEIVLGLLANLRRYAAVQAACEIPAVATTGAGLASMLDGIDACLRSCDTTLSAEDRQRQNLRVTALQDQLEAFGGAT